MKKVESASGIGNLAAYDESDNDEEQSYVIPEANNESSNMNNDHSDSKSNSTDNEIEEDEADMNISESDGEDSHHATPRFPDLTKAESKSSTPSLGGHTYSMSQLMNYGVEDLNDSNSESDDVSNDDDESNSPNNVDVHFDAEVNDTPCDEELKFDEEAFIKTITDVRIPPLPPKRCSKEIEEKIQQIYKKVKQGADINVAIQDKKFRNPCIYEHLIQYCGIKENGTNYSPQVFDPFSWSSSSFYDELARVQKTDMERREKERKERSKIDFISKKNDSDKKSKWDSSQSSAPSTTIPLTGPLAAGISHKALSAAGLIKRKLL